jgi:hypothetical protein
MAYISVSHYEIVNNGATGHVHVCRRLVKITFCGNGHMSNNRTVGRRVFYAVRAKVTIDSIITKYLFSLPKRNGGYIS